MRKENPDTSQILKIALIGVGAYLLYEYVIAPMMAQQTAAAPLPATTPVTAPAGTNVILTQPVTGPTSSPNPQPVASAPAANSALVSQLLAAAQQNGLNPNNMTTDQWSYLYQNSIIPQRSPISPQTFVAAMATIGAASGNVVSVNQFVQALSSQGLSGIVGRIPSMTFGGAYKGFRAPIQSRMVN